MATCKECFHYEVCLSAQRSVAVHHSDNNNCCLQYKDKSEYVKQKHGRWEKANKRPKSYIYRCSACGGEAYFCGGVCGYDYCPNCFAKMDGEIQSPSRSSSNSSSPDM